MVTNNQTITFVLRVLYPPEPNECDLGWGINYFDVNFKSLQFPLFQYTVANLPVVAIQTYLVGQTFDIR